jgi:hypothetical protein
VHDRLLVDVIDGGQDALREFLFGDDAYVAQHGARELGEEALDEVQPRAMLRSEGKFEATLRLCREPGFGHARERTRLRGACSCCNMYNRAWLG